MKFPLTVFCHPHCSATKVPSSTAITGDTSSCIDQDPLAPPMSLRKGFSSWTEPPEHLPGAARLTWTPDLYQLVVSWLRVAWPQQLCGTVGHRYSVGQCHGPGRMIYAQPCLEKLMHVSDKTIFIAFPPLLFVLKCWRGFQQ